MSLIRHYRFNEPDLTVDSSGNSINLTSTGNVTSTTDATFGNVASFPGASGDNLSTSSFSDIEGASPRTFSCWVNRDDTDSRAIFNHGVTGTSGTGRFTGFFSAGTGQFRLHHGTGIVDAFDAFPINTWFHFAITYDGSTITLYVNGVSAGSNTTTLVTGTSDLTIGSIGNSFRFVGEMSDFRIYDGVIDAATVAALYIDGPNGDVPRLSVTMYTHLADLEWEEVDGASSYTVTSSRDSGPEETLVTTPNTTHEELNLTPDSSYEFKVYSDLDPVEPAYTTTSLALTLNAVNVDSFIDRLGNDLTLVNDTTLGEIEPFFNSVLTTGEVVNTSIGSTVFVENSGTVTIDEPEEVFLTSFEETLGTGQNITVVLPDTSNSVIGYDESVNEVTSASTNYPVGSHFVLGGRKVTVKEI